MSDNVMDPLKFHTQGVKRPIDAKMERIQELEEQNKRYYPNDKHGNIDEWGAVIKKQAERYNQEEQDRALKKVKDAMDYSNELQREIQQKEMQKMNDRNSRQMEINRFNQDVQAQQQMNQVQQAEHSKFMQHYGNQAKTVIELQRQQANQMKMQNLQEEVQIVSRDQEAANRFKQAQLEQKMKFQQIVTSENAQQIQLRQQLESQRLAQDKQNIMTSPQKLGNGYDSQRKYLEMSQNKNQMISQNYQSRVAYEEGRRKAQVDQMINKNEQLAKERGNQQAQWAQNENRKILDNNAEMLANQKQEYARMRQQQIQNEKASDEKMAQQWHNQKLALDHRLAEMKMSSAARYKEDLDRQINQKAQMQKYGNMSNVEKQINKADLRAWKDGDNNNYSLIPGISATKSPKYKHGKSVDAGLLQSQVDKDQRDMDRIKQMGYFKNQDPHNRFSNSMNNSALKDHYNPNQQQSVQVQPSANQTIDQTQINIDLMNQQQKPQNQPVQPIQPQQQFVSPRQSAPQLNQQDLHQPQLNMQQIRSPVLSPQHIVQNPLISPNSQIQSALSRNKAVDQANTMQQPYKPLQANEFVQPVRTQGGEYMIDSDFKKVPGMDYNASQKYNFNIINGNQHGSYQGTGAGSRFNSQQKSSLIMAAKNSFK